MKALILAAGVGSRLGSSAPKPLTALADGVSIMEQQIANLTRYVAREDILVVVGHKKELIMEAFPSLTYVYNNRFDTTNTSKSLLLGLLRLRGHDALCLNGDVVFDHEVLPRLTENSSSSLAVKYGAVGDEEVKFRTDAEGWIQSVSKTVVGGLGEAVGINLVMARDMPLVVEELAACGDQEYFERGVERAVERGARFRAVDVSDLRCTEVDFAEDLEQVNRERSHIE